MTDKAYEGDLFSRDERFKPTFYEWLSMQGQQITRYILTTGQLYDVPAGYILYITNVWLTQSNTTIVNDTSARIFIKDTGANIVDMMLWIKCPIDEVSSNSLNYKIPLRVDENRQVYFTQDANVKGSAGFVGILVHKKTAEAFFKL